MMAKFKDTVGKLDLNGTFPADPAHFQTKGSKIYALNFVAASDRVGMRCLEFFAANSPSRTT
jgi:hypothetical protein